jgi:hypothetical protein
MEEISVEPTQGAPVMVLQFFMPFCLLAATRAGLGGDVRRGILLNLHHGAGIVEGLLVLAGRGVGAVLQREAVRERGGGREQEQRGGGAGSLGGEGTADGEEEQRR